MPPDRDGDVRAGLAAADRQRDAASTHGAATAADHGAAARHGRVVVDGADVEDQRAAAQDGRAVGRAAGADPPARPPLLTMIPLPVPPFEMNS